MLELKVTGYIATNFEIKTIPSKTGGVLNFVKFNIAENVKNGNSPEKTLWIRCTVWDMEAVHLYENAVKGNYVEVKGYPKISTYTNKNGESVTDIDLNVREFAVLPPPSKKSNAGEGFEHSQVAEKEKYVVTELDPADIPF